jgi:ATP-binding cassette subfamily B protein
MRPQALHETLPTLERIYRHFWPYIRPHWGLIAGSFLALLIEVGLRALEPWPLKFIFDHLLGSKRHSGRLSPPLVDQLDTTTLLAVSVLSLVAITGLRALADYCSTIGFATVGSRVLTEVRTKLYRHLQGLSLSFHTKERNGDLILRVISDVTTVKDVTVNAVVPLIGDLLVLLGMVAVMFWVQWRLTLVVIATVPLFWLWTTRLGRRVRQAARRQRQCQGALAATVAESLGAIKDVQALSLEDTFTGLFSSHNQQSLSEDLRTNRLAAALKRSVEVLVAIATALVLWYGALLVMRQELTAGDLLVFAAYLRTAFKSVQSFARYSGGRLARAAAAGDRVLDILERTPEVRDLPGAIPAPPLRGELQFEGVRFAYETDHWVLKHINFHVEAGQHVALVGPSGIGKSTLAALVLRLYDPVQGRVLIDGRDIREYTVASLRTQISVVLQDSLLFAASVRENIAYGAPEATRADVEAAARLANAHDFILGLPRGYETVLGERGVSLSEGQRQRIAIARAAIRRSPILILDEPTTGLDEENERAVIEALQRLAKGRTTLLITHDLQFAARADLVLYLEDGSILEHGTPDELMHAGGRYATLCQLQTAGSNNGGQPADRLSASGRQPMAGR